MKLKFLLVSVLLASTLLVGAGPVSADSRCSGNPGFQVWENPNKGGGSAYGCGVGWYRSEFWNWYDNLFFGASWDDRISSYETFNFTGHAVRFYNNGYKGGATLTTTGNEYISNLQDWNRNDVFSSGWIMY
ncbi:MAG: hypothetical protein V4515_07635 [Chloroflexota bacterium]